MRGIYSLPLKILAMISVANSIMELSIKLFVSKSHLSYWSNKFENKHTKVKKFYFVCSINFTLSFSLKAEPMVEKCHNEKSLNFQKIFNAVEFYDFDSFGTHGQATKL